MSTQIFVAQKTLDSITPVVQTQPNRCWAASDEMVGKYYYKFKRGDTSTVTQADVATYIFGSPIDQGGSPDKTRRGLLYAGRTVVPYIPYFTADTTTPVNFEYASIQTFINTGRPVITAILYPVDGAAYGHALVVDGYNDTNNQIRCIDPYDGTRFWVNFADFESEFPFRGYTARFGSVNGSGAWGVRSQDL